MCLNAALFCHFRPCRRDSYKSPFLIAICLHICQAKPIITMTHDWFHKTMHVLKQHGMRASLSSFLVEPHRELFCSFKDIRRTLWTVLKLWREITLCTFGKKVLHINNPDLYKRAPRKRLTSCRKSQLNTHTTKTDKNQLLLCCKSSIVYRKPTWISYEFNVLLC